MKTIHVKTSQGTYPIVLGGHLMGQMAVQLQQLGFKSSTKVTVITDAQVVKLPFVEELTQSLSNAQYVYQVLTIPSGDASKTLEQANRLYGELISFGMRRKDLIIALGGGVVGDLAGFVAATFLRGIPFIQAPTTLLAHDSSVGGKVGVNLPQGKNLVGAFYPPRAVLYDLSTLAFLPLRQWINGMAEVIKHGLIDNAELFDQLEATPLTTCPDPDKLEPILASAMQVKVDIVEQDERESGRRQALNVGHTIGHAVEQRSHYALGHGEAISIGMALEARIAANRGLVSMADVARIEKVLLAHGLPITPPRDEWDAVATVIDVDKKHGTSAWTFALPTGIGRVEIFSDVLSEEVEQVYRECQGD